MIICDAVLAKLASDSKDLGYRYCALLGRGQRACVVPAELRDLSRL